MFGKIKKIFKKNSKQRKKDESGSKAKERLHLVLMQDRANVSADFMEIMKQEIIEVIKKYIDIDENSIDVKLTNKTNPDGTKGAPMLYANIPIVNVKDDQKTLNIERGKDKKSSKIKSEPKATSVEEKRKNESETVKKETDPKVAESKEIEKIIEPAKKEEKAKLTTTKKSSRTATKTKTTKIVPKSTKAKANKENDSANIALKRIKMMEEQDRTEKPEKIEEDQTEIKESTVKTKTTRKTTTKTEKNEPTKKKQASTKGKGKNKK